MKEYWSIGQEDLPFSFCALLSVSGSWMICRYTGASYPVGMCQEYLGPKYGESTEGEE